MQLMNTLPLPLLWAAATVSCFPTDGGALHLQQPAPISVSNITWTGEIHENGPNMTFTGSSLKAIEEQIKEFSPGFSPGVVLSSSENVTFPGVERVFLKTVGDEVAQGTVWESEVLAGIEAIRGYTGYCRQLPTLQGQPLSCSKPFCQYGRELYNAILFCNHNTWDAVQRCSVFADHAQRIYDRCYDPTGDEKLFKGQSYDGDGFSVIVGSVDHC
ncbi:Uu.00g009570.m01.CDS01 [Anthostomella pinea]|uniref:Uu.00g009570.m01.CDS01 n=1 Tax=Anthostomella pinea TaxID=933095 RepID=A0AAI8VYM9_9PEZI|nr:Uu.00g009570.m01.CDS01 [Anthostomella pinea]